VACRLLRGWESADALESVESVPGITRLSKAISMTADLRRVRRQAWAAKLKRACEMLCPIGHHHAAAAEFGGGVS